VENIKINDIVMANSFGAEYDLTENETYIITDVCGTCIAVIDDTGKNEWYSKDYFWKVASK